MPDWMPIVGVAGGVISTVSVLITIFLVVRNSGSNSAEVLIAGYAGRVKELEASNEKCEARVAVLEGRVQTLEKVLGDRDADRGRELQSLYRQNDELRQELRECRRELDDLKHRAPRRHEDPPDTDFAGGKA